VVKNSFHVSVADGNVFAENRFRFLVEWDPNALAHAGIDSGCWYSSMEFVTFLERKELVCYSGNIYIS
jgi:hypothetical protein